MLIFQSMAYNYSTIMHLRAGFACNFFCNQKNNGEQCSPSQVLVSIEGVAPLRQQIFEVDARFHATR